jgi:hypothetical protein
MASIYISYSTKDAEIALRIAENLRLLGHNINMDVGLLSAGQPWRGVMDEALKASDVFVSLLTEHSISSSFVLTELGSARAYMQTSKQMLVIPVVFEGVSIPQVISDIQVLIVGRMDAATIAEKIHEAISAFIGRRAAEEEKAGEIRQRIESNAGVYIDETLRALSQQETKNRRIGNLWYLVGYSTLIAGVGFGFYSISQIIPSTDQQWLHFAYRSLKSVIVIGLLLACSRYAFVLGKAYMSEALKSADRVHAISFGKFYLRAFGEAANYAELKEVFQHWNIGNGSSFSSLDTNNYDPKFLEAIIEIAKVVASKGELKK